MESVVFISLCMPLSASKFSLQELQLRKVPLARLSSQTTIRTTTNLLASCCSNGDMISVRSCCQYVTPLDHFGEFASCCVNVSSCTDKIISGYWVGPDIDDGWGFVEAFVNQLI